MKYWVWKGGRPDHSGSAHDDCILAMAIALYNIAEGIKSIRSKDDAFFFDENGNAITIKEEENTLTSNYFNSREDRGRNLNESFYKREEEKMYASAGIDKNDPNAADTYKWLIS